jgi:hypothetical protein
LIPLRLQPPPSFKASSSGSKVVSKVVSNSNLAHNNFVVKLFCLGGLPTFVAPMPNLLEIYVVLDEESDVRLPKKPKKNYDISHKCKETWLSYSIPLSRNVKKCYGKVNKVKCTVYSFVKGKDVFLGPNSDTFEKHVRKTKVI